MGSSPFARTTKKEVTKVASFFCEVRSTLSVAQSIHPTAQRVPPVATAKRGNAYQFENSVPERGFSCTESTRGTVEGLLWYARRFQRHSVRKTGFWCTEWKFGAKNGLLVYGMDIRCGAGVLQNNHRGTERPPSRETTTEAQNNNQGTTTTGAQNNRRGTRGAATIYSSRLQASQCVTAETLTCYSSKRLFSRA